MTFAGTDANCVGIDVTFGVMKGSVGETFVNFEATGEQASPALNSEAIGGKSDPIRAIFATTAGISDAIGGNSVTIVDTFKVRDLLSYEVCGVARVSAGGNLIRITRDNAQKEGEC